MHHDPSPLTLRTDDGVDLEAEAVLPAVPVAAVVLAHPHPLQGGNMRSLVPGELFRTLPAAGVATLRFNFRGVEGSGGTHGGGVDERLDVLAAIDALSLSTPGVSLFLCGWSFGGDVSLSVVDARVAGWCGVAAPLRILPLDDLAAGPDPRPKLLAVPERDQFCAPDCAHERTAGWTATTIEVVGGADHFLVGRTDRVATLVEAFVTGAAPPA